MTDFDSLRIAIVHEWIDAYAGSEQVFEAIAQIFPKADLYALSHTPGVDLDLGGRDVKTTFLNHPMLRDRRSLTLPIMPLAWRVLGKGDYDLVISSHHAFAHANRLVRPRGKHLSYVHSPARYVWSPEIDGRGAPLYLEPARALLKRVDRAASRRVDSYAANSTAVAQRINRYWGQTAEVIPPPVRVEYFADGAKAGGREYVLGVGRWIPYKNLHLVIEVANRAGLPVKIAGRGPDKSRIVAAATAAKVPVELIESPTDDELRILYQGALCLVFPTVEDFGIVPVEAQASGTPVVALSSGGAVDTVVTNETGILVSSLDLNELAAAIKLATALHSTACIENAQSFTRHVFASRISHWVNSMAHPHEAADFGTRRPDRNTSSLVSR